MYELHGWFGLAESAEETDLGGLVIQNRKRGTEIDDLLRFVSRRPPGSYGLLYERDDEMRIPPGPNAFRVTVLARETCVPVIED